MIPDAPWIRNAELYGVDEPDPVICPICGEECGTIYKDRNGDVFGCDNCVEIMEAYDYLQEEKEASLPD